MTSSLLARASARYFLRAPWQLGLAGLGIALGVALAVGIDLAGASVQRALERSVEVVSGRATHEIVGGPSGVPEGLYRDLRLGEHGDLLAPFVGGVARVEGRPEVLQIIGGDPFAETGSSWAGWSEPGLRQAWGELLTRPGAAALSRETARRLGLAVGSALSVRTGAGRVRFDVAALLEPRDDRERWLLDGVLLADVATVQEALGQTGWLTRVEVRVPRGAAGEKALEGLAAKLPAPMQLQPVGARTSALLGMTRAFELNLRALSLLGLLVGAFLVYNAITFSVVQRRPLLAILRVLGVTRRQLLRVIVLEAAVLGTLGAALGVAAGAALARALVQLVGRAVSDLYFPVDARVVELPALVLGRGAALGLAAAVLSALPAAWEAGRTEPRVALLRSTLEGSTRRRLPLRAALGALFALGALGILTTSERSLPLGLLAIAWVLVGAALVAPGAAALLARAMGPALSALGRLPGRMAARSFVASLSRTGVAVAALMIALSVTVGISLMVHSFRGAVIAWLEDTLGADVYVSAAPLVAARNEARLPRSLAPRLRAVPGVAAVSTARGVTLSTASGPVYLSAIELAPGRRPRLHFLEGESAAAWRSFDTAGAVLVSEPYAYRTQTTLEDAVTLHTRTGPRAFPVAGIFRDYGSDVGAVLMSRAVYDRHFDDAHVTALALFVAPGVSPDELASRVRHALAGEGLMVRPTRVLREATLVVFDRTFEVTAVLRLLALVVAVFGVTAALMALALERRRELGVLRALGFTAGQVARLVALETSLIGFLAGLLAAPVGAALAALLVRVINRRAFGWTMDLILDARTLALAPVLGLAAGLVGGLYPAWMMTRASAAEALREE